mgnify:CR=1 FL=1
MKIALLILCLSFPLLIFACSCNEPLSIKEAYAITPVILSGKVLRLSYISIWETMAPKKRIQAKEAFLKTQPQTKVLENPIIQKIEFEVLKNYKGKNIKDTIIIFTHRSGASCGFTWFEAGKDFIIYAGPDSFCYDFYNPNKVENLEQKNTYWTNQCTRTINYHEEEGNKLMLLSKK